MSDEVQPDPGPRFVVLRHELSYSVVDTQAPKEEWDTGHGKIVDYTASASAPDAVDELRKLTAEAEVKAFTLNAAHNATKPVPDQTDTETIGPDQVANLASLDGTLTPQAGE